MSEWRQDPLSGRWVVIAAERGGRPDDFAGPRPAPPDAAECPFCPDREAMTTPECLVLGRPPGACADGPGWRVRVFPNLYPALVPVPPVPAAGPGAAAPARGRHEVVVTSPRHEDALRTLGAARLAEVLGVLRTRMRELAAAPDVRHVLAFFNEGAAAGATIAHPHGQILAAARVPALVRRELEHAAAHRARAGTCLLCGLLAREEEDGRRLVAANAGAVAVAPWASRFAYEVLVAPRRHAPGLTGAADGDLDAVAEVLDRVLAGLARAAETPDLNLILHAAPTAGDGAEVDYHWHLELLPRIAGLAGFEVGSGCAINTLPPEQAARRLRGEEA